MLQRSVGMMLMLERSRVHMRVLPLAMDVRSSLDAEPYLMRPWACTGLPGRMDAAMAG